MDKSQAYCRIERVSDDVQLCFVDIYRFVERYIKSVDCEHFRRKKSIYFDPNGALSNYFSDSDFLTVNRFKILKKQVEWMAGKIAVKKLVARLSGEKEKTIAISAEKSGAPFLDDFSEMMISISHSERFAVAGVGIKKHRVAVDIEKIESGRMKTIGRVAFSDRELDELKGQNDEWHYLAWTVKEAYLKYIGKGFAEGLKKVEFLNGSIYHHGKKAEGIVIDSKIMGENYAFTVIY